MSRLKSNAPPVSLSVAVRSYLGEWQRWISGLGMRYGTAMALIASGGIFVGVAFAIGAAALFHFLETRYGPYAAYAVLGGSFFLLGLIGIIAGLTITKRPKPPVPRLLQHAQPLKYAFAAPAAARLLSTLQGNGNLKPDRMTQALAGAAALTLAGWIASSFIRRPGPADRDGR